MTDNLNFIKLNLLIAIKIMKSTCVYLCLADGSAKGPLLQLMLIATIKYHSRNLKCTRPGQRADAAAAASWSYCSNKIKQVAAMEATATATPTVTCSNNNNNMLQELAKSLLHTPSHTNKSSAAAYASQKFTLCHIHLRCLLRTLLSLSLSLCELIFCLQLSLPLHIYMFYFFSFLAR